MIREEDLIKHSGIIEYLEERIKYHKKQLKQWEIGTVGYLSERWILDELKLALKHFKEMTENAENRDK